MENKNIIVIGASSGGFEKLKEIIHDLPEDLDAAVFIVWHMSPDLKGILPQMLNQQKTLFAAHAVDKEPIVFNRIYVAPPDHHLLLEDGFVRVTRGPRENRFRPAVDPLFRSAAYIYNTRVIGIVLSGALDDGTAGLWTIKSRGGTTIVQSDAEVPSMPQNAFDNVEIDHYLPASEIGPLLARLTAEPAPEYNSSDPEEDHQTAQEIQMLKLTERKPGILNIGKPSSYACPECHGVLSVIHEGKIMRFRCHTGHAYSADSLLASVTENVENTLWNAFRGMEETVILLNNLGDHFAENNQPAQAAAYFNKAKETEAKGVIIRNTLSTHEQLTMETINKSVPEIAEKEKGYA